MRNLKLVEIFLLSLFTFSVQSQVNFRPGFIITNDHDTIYGKVDYRSDYRMCKVCTFKSKKVGKKKYSADEILGYGFEKGRFFETNNVDGKPKFLELLIKGELCIYYRIDETKRHYFFKKGSNDLVELKYSEYTVNIDKFGKGDDGILYDSIDYPHPYSKAGKYLIKSKKYKKVLLDSLKDKPELSSQINNLIKPDHKGLINLAKKYQELKCNNREFIVYHNLYIKSNYDFSIGWININYRKIQTEKKYLIYSFKGYAPLSNGKMYLGYGIQYASFHTPYYSYKMYRIPLSIRYQYPGIIFKPHAAFGLNFYNISDGEKYEFIHDFVPSYSIGFAVKLFRSIYVSFDLDGDFLWNSYYNSSSSAPFSSTYYVGLMINL
jgi:hypothetical protein